MEGPLPKPLRKYMAGLHRSNRRFWKRCVRLQGLTSSTVVRLSGRFGVQEPDARERLMEALEARTYAVVSESPGHSMTEIEFEVPPRAWTPADWDEWSDEMTVLGVDIETALFGGITGIEVVRDRAAVLADAKRRQRERNAAVWRALVESGVDADTLLALDAEFWAHDEQTAAALSHRLTAELDYATVVSPPDPRSRGRERRWGVTGTRRARRTDPAAIDAWTDAMVELADATGTSFDGWGTLVP